MAANLSVHIQQWKVSTTIIENMLPQLFNRIILKWSSAMHFYYYVENKIYPQLISLLLINTSEATSIATFQILGQFQGALKHMAKIKL